MENPENTNPNIPSNIYWAKIWCILLKKQSQWPWISLTGPTELKSSSPWRNLKEVMTLDCIHTLVPVSSSLLQKIIDHKHLNPLFFTTLRFLGLRKKFYHKHVFWDKNQIFSKSWALSSGFKCVRGFIVKRLYAVNEFDQRT